MSRLHFADTTALINFCHIGRLDLLETLLNGNGAWTATVASECETSSRYPGLSELAHAELIFGEPYAPANATEYLAVDAVREKLRIPGDGAEKHLGEAETLALIEIRSLAAIVVTDDMGALRLAKTLDIPAIGTATLLIVAVKAGRIEAQDCWDYLQALRNDHGRHLPDCPESFADLLARCGLLR